MFLAAVATSLPEHRYDQQSLVAALTTAWSKSHHNLGRLARFHENVRVASRHLCLPIERYPELSFEEANKTFVEVGTKLGSEAVTKALTKLGLEPRDIDAIYTTTVTGVATPSLDARMTNQLGLRSDVKRVPLFGLGCVAGAAGAARLADYLRGHPDDIAVLVSVELCSLTLQRGDFSVANLVASGLFGDGAACLIGIGERRAERLGISAPRVLASRSSFYPNTERVMGWDITNTGFQIVLSSSVPEVVRGHIRADVDSFLSAHSLGLADIARWVCHPGGPKVLEAFEDCLELPRDALALTWESLERVGNLSSASVLFVLAETLARPAPEAGSHGLLIAMGPGFCAELVLLQW
jgi:alkylresorcinol/alkylpyrone synthase